MIDPKSQYKFYKTAKLTVDGKLKIVGGTSIELPVDYTDQYNKIKEITFDDDGNLNIIIDDSPYTGMSAVNARNFWKNIKVIEGYVVVTTI